MSPSSVLNRLLIKSRIRPSRQRKILIWFELISLLVSRDLKVRYRGSVFGYLWSMANPLLYMIILSLVFSKAMKVQTHNFPLYVLTGIITWNFFSQSLAIGVNSILANGSLLKKVQVPAAIFPAASVMSVFVNFCLSLIPYVLLSVFFLGNVSPTLLLLPLFLVPFALFIFGLVLVISALNVSFRDIGHVLEPILQALFYATPIVYVPENLSDRIQVILEFNPMTHFVRVARTILFKQEVPTFHELQLISAFALVAIIIGALTFRKRRHRFIYEL